MDSELQRWIQENTSSNVTEKFVATLKQIARLHQDINKFIGAAKALGKFKNKDDFLKELFTKLREEQNETKGSATTAAPALAAAPTALPEPRIKRKKFAVKFSKPDDDYGDKDEEDEEEEELGISIKPKFKKRLFPGKVRAGSSTQAVVKPDPETERETSLDVNDTNNSDLEDIKDDQDFLSQDRNWYDNNDSFENVIQTGVDDAVAGDLSRENTHDNDDADADMIEPEIQLRSLTLKERKSLIPPFLLDFHDQYGEHEIIGAMDASTSASNKNIVNPIRNPESDFSINSRKGSKLVAMRRLQKDRKTKSANAAKLQGSALGSLLGVEDGTTDTGEKANSSVNPQIDSSEKEQSFEQIQAIRRTLPAFKVRDDLLRFIRDNQVTVVIGETGSGKTTQLAQFLYEDGFSANGSMIGCTQPRRVAAVSVADRVAKEMNTPLGEKVGYSIRFEDQTSNLTKIKFMTDGILLREAMIDPLLEKYSCIIMDEAHERSLNTDVLLGIFKTLLARRRDLKLIVTSATMNADKFSQFFGNAPQFHIPGKTFPVEINYTNHPVSDYVEAAVHQALDIHLSTPLSNGDILIFMTGQEDIEATCDTIIERLTEIYTKKYGAEFESHMNDVRVLPIYSSLPADVQNRIFQRQQENTRKIVVATNIAETSLTVDGIKYVIDCGYSKLKVYNPKIGLDSLRITPISLANANQRSGRAGRTGPGVAYRLYTHDSAIEDMYPQAIPEIQRTNLSNTLLQLKSLNISDVSKFPFIDAPPSQNLMTSLYDLWTLGALDNFGNLTKLGRLMSSFPLQPFLSKILICASGYGCTNEMLTIVSMLSVPSVFYRPKEREEESDQERSRFFVPESDHLTLLNVYSQWKANRWSAHWCNSHFIQYKSLQRARFIREQLLYVIKKQGLPISSSGADWSPIRKCLCAGYINQTAKLSGLGKYIHLKTGMELRIHPTSALFGVGDLPPYVVYHELLMTTREYINVVTAVDPLWIMEISGIFYHIRRRKEKPDVTTNDSNSNPPDGKDSIDTQIEKLQENAQKAIKQLQQDKTTFESQRNSQKLILESDDSFEEKEQPSVRIGIKRRKPL